MFICVGVGLGVALVVCCIHVCSFFYEKLAMDQVTPIRRRTQRASSTVNTRFRTSHTKQNMMNAFRANIFVGLGVALIFALICGRGVCNKMQQNKIEVAFVCGGHNVGPASDEDGCCSLHLQNNGKASPRREGQHISLCSQVVQFRGQPTLACIDCVNHSIASPRGITSIATDKRPQRRAAAATSASATRQLRNTP